MSSQPVAQPAVEHFEQKKKKAQEAAAVPVSVLKTAKGGGILAFGKVIETVGRIAIAFLLARLLGADDFGQYTLALATSTMVASVGKFGMDSALVRYVAIVVGQRDEAGVRGILHVAIGIALGVSVLLGTGLYLLAQPIAVAIYQEPKLVLLLQLAAVMVPIAVLSDMLIGVSRGFKRMHYSVIAQDIAHLVIRLLLIGLLFVFGKSTFWAVATYGIADLLSVFILLYLINQVFPWKRALEPARYQVGEVLRFSVPLFLSEILKKFRGDIQTILLGAMYSVASVGVFSAANKINVVSRISSFSLMTSAEPAFAELHDRGDRAQMRELYQATSRWMFVLNFPVIILTMLFAKPLLSILGESFVSGESALILLSLASLINISTGLGGTIIDMTGYTKLKLVNSVSQLTLFVATSVLLIPPWGVIGAASAAMISSSIIQIARMVQVAYLFKMQPYDHWFMKAIAAAGITTLCGYVTRAYFATDSSIVTAALHTFVLAALYIALLLLFGLAPQDRAVFGQMVNRLFSMLPGRKWALGWLSTGAK